MKTIRTMLATFFVMCLLTVSLSTNASDLPSPDECKARITLVQIDLDKIDGAGGIGGRNPDRTYDSLTSKLQGAIKKTDQQKQRPDAIQKLEDAKTAIIAMRDASKPKLESEDAALLLDGDDLKYYVKDYDMDVYSEGIIGAIGCLAMLP